MAKKKIITLIVIALVLLPFLSSVRRAIGLYGSPGFEDQTFIQLLWNQVQGRYLSVFTDFGAK